ncbi:MAG: hypothetical protein AB7O59_10280 [Pirellulales bacterium]
MLFVSIFFWVLLSFSRDELGFKGTMLAIAAWVGLLAGYALTSTPMLFMSAVAVVDAALVVIAFRGDLRIR